MTTPEPGALTTDHRGLVIPARFCGPDESGNGGWVCGSLAGDLLRHIDPRAAVTVTLRVPPPLDRPLRLVARDDGVVGVDLVDDRQGGSGESRAAGEPARVASAVVADPLPEAEGLPRVTPDEAAAVRDGFPGLTRHPYARCYACGTQRSPGDGLRLTPAPVPGGDPWWASAWTPTEVSEPIVWAALDCPTGWAAGAGARYLLLGRMTARVRELPPVGARCVLLARRTGGQGRKAYAESFLTLDGRVLAQATTVWIETGPPA